MTHGTAARRRVASLVGSVAVALALVWAVANGATAAPSTAAPATAAPATAPSTPTPVPTADITVFWGDGCPNCAKQEEWMETALVRYPGLTVERVEVWNSAPNRERFQAVGEDLGFEASSVPTVVIGERVWIGWTGAIEQDMAAAIAMTSQGTAPAPGVFGTPGAGTCADDSLVCSAAPEPLTVTVPLFGEVVLGSQSLLVSTLIIGFVDGMNPCSLWVLSILLAIVLRTGSRRRVLAIGTTFLGITAAMYGLYMAAFYSALTVVGYLGIIQWVVALTAGIFGVVSVKDYFAFKKGLSFTIPDKAKPGIYQRMRAAAAHHRLLPALGATVVLAVGVSLLETPCTAGFPVLWTGMLHAAGVGPAQTGLLFVAYMIPFLLDEIAVFVVAVITMRSTKLQDKHGELLKLFAGVTMLVLAAVMVIRPALMESPLLALALFAAAFALAAAIHAVTSRVRAARAQQELTPSRQAS